MFPRIIDGNLPRTVNEAVDTLLADLPLLERTRLAQLNGYELDLFNRVVG